MIEDLECLKTLSTNIAFWLELSSIASLSAMKTLTLVLPKVAFWGLDKVSFDLDYDASGEVLLTFGETAPYETSIVGNYPNPFNPSTTIEFNLAKAGFVDVTIYDLQGRKVVNLHSGNLDQAQGHTFNWDANNVASGKYFARITAPGFSDVINMTLLK